MSCWMDSPSAMPASMAPLRANGLCRNHSADEPCLTTGSRVASGAGPGLHNSNCFHRIDDGWTPPSVLLAVVLLPIRASNLVVGEIGCVLRHWCPGIAAVAGREVGQSLGRAMTVRLVAPSRSYIGRPRVMASASSTRDISSAVSRPTRAFNRLLSIERIWSPSARPGFALIPTIASPGYRESTLLVIGSTTTLAPYRLQESFDTTTAGRVFRISLPMTGSRVTQYTSPRRGARFTRASPRRR